MSTLPKPGAFCYKKVTLLPFRIRMFTPPLSFSYNNLYFRAEQFQGSTAQFGERIRRDSLAQDNV